MDTYLRRNKTNTILEVTNKIFFFCPAFKRIELLILLRNFLSDIRWIGHSDSSKLCCVLLSVLFTKDEQNTSSLSGQVGNFHKEKDEIQAKEKLDPEHITALYGNIHHIFCLKFFNFIWTILFDWHVCMITMNSNNGSYHLASATPISRLSRLLNFDLAIIFLL